jgi:hypothetical protein
MDASKTLIPLLPFVPGFAFSEIVAVDNDGKGRQWSIIEQDKDVATGANTVQLPDLAGSGTTGLAPGAWKIRVEDTLIYSFSFTNDKFMLSARRRQPVTFARSKPEEFTVN